MKKQSEKDMIKNIKKIEKMNKNKKAGKNGKGDKNTRINKSKYDDALYWKLLKKRKQDEAIKEKVKDLQQVVDKVLKKNKNV